MPKTPFQSQSRYEGGRRPWNLAPIPVKARSTGYQCKTRREEIEACLSCPLPECEPYYCKNLRAVRKQAREQARLPGVPKDFLIRLDLGDSTAELARRYGVTSRTVNYWKKAVKENEAAPAATGTTSKENTSGPVYHRRAETSRKERK